MITGKCVVNIGGKRLYATLVDREIAPSGLKINGSLFILSEEPESETLGCLVVYRTQTLSAVWRPPIASRDLLDKLYLLILPYIKFNIDAEKIFKMYSNCFLVVIGTGEEGINDKEVSVKGGANAEALIKRLIYGGDFSREKVQSQILMYLSDYYWNQSQNTKVLVGDLQESLFIPQNIFDPNLDFLIKKGFVEPLFDQSQNLISISISPEGIEYVENGFQKPPSAVQIIQNMGDQINTTINGNSNVVNIKGELNQFFLTLETEIEAKNEPNKTEVLEEITELKKEMEGGKDFNKIQSILAKVKNSADWVHEKIIKHPVVAQVIAQAVAAQIGLK